MTVISVFQEVDHALLDLQGSTSQTFARPMKRLASVFESEDLKPHVEMLTENVDLEEFLSANERQAGIVGGDTLEWPDDDVQVLGLTLLLSRKFAAEPDFLLEFGYTYYHAGSKYTANLHAVVRQLLIPFSRDFKTYVLSKGQPKPKLIRDFSKKVFIVQGHDGEARETIARFLSSIELEPIILHEQANRGRTIIEKRRRLRRGIVDPRRRRQRRRQGPGAANPAECPSRAGLFHRQVGA